MNSVNCFPRFANYPWLRGLLPPDGLVPGISPDTPVSELEIIAIDTETTGTNPMFDRVVEFAAVSGQNETIIATLVRPGTEIPSEATEVHGIRSRDIEKAPTFRDALGNVQALYRGVAVPLAYNAEFDRQILKYECRRHGIWWPFLDFEWIDPLVWARHLFPTMKSRRLGALCEKFQIETGESHRAEADAKSALQVWENIRGGEGIPKTYGGLIASQKNLALTQFQERRWR